MVSNRIQESRYRCLFFGMHCAFSTIVLDALRGADLELVGIVTPDRSAKSSASVSTPRPFLLLHDADGQLLDTIPRFPVRSLRNAAVQASLIATSPDLIVVACFPWLIPSALTETARLAAINLHPSLLPRWRGPDPIFWTFHTGDRESGITLHHLAKSFDTGPILSQRAITIGDGETLPELESRLAEHGGAMLADLVQSLPIVPTARRQEESRITAAPVADEADRTIDATWTVDRARRFIVGVASSHGPLWYRSATGELQIIASLAGPESADQIALADGSLEVTFGSVRHIPESSQF